MSAKLVKDSGRSDRRKRFKHDDVVVVEIAATRIGYKEKFASLKCTSLDMNAERQDMLPLDRPSPFTERWRARNWSSFERWLDSDRYHNFCNFRYELEVLLFQECKHSKRLEPCHPNVIQNIAETIAFHKASLSSYPFPEKQEFFLNVCEMMILRLLRHRNPKLFDKFFIHLRKMLQTIGDKDVESTDPDVYDELQSLHIKSIDFVKGDVTQCPMRHSNIGGGNGIVPRTPMRMVKTLEYEMDTLLDEFPDDHDLQLIFEFAKVAKTIKEPYFSIAFVFWVAEMVAVKKRLDTFKAFMTM